MTEQLYINNVYIPLSKSINPSITKSITDVKNPEKRKATYSKTTTIPNSAEAQKVFGHIFDLNIVNGTFDPTVKADVLYLVSDEPIIEGYCQLKSINQVEQIVESYDIVMFGSISSLFGEIGEDELKDLATGFTGSLDRWNHPQTKEVIKFSWDTQIYDSSIAGFIPFALGQGYVYPLIDYGRTTDLTTWPFYEMPMALYAKTYMEAIEAYSGITFESTFLESDYFKSMIIPSSPDNYQLTQSEILDRQVSANTPELTSTGTTTSTNLPKSFGFSTPDTIKFTNELSDTSGIYDPTTGVITITPTTEGNQTFTALLDVFATFTPLTGVPVAVTSDIEGYFMIFVNGLQVQAQQFRISYDDFPVYTIGPRSTAASAVYPDTDYVSSNSDLFSTNPSPSGVTLTARPNNPPNRFQVSYTYYGNNTDTIEIKWKARYRGSNGNNSNMVIDSVLGFHDANATLTIDVAAFYTKYNNTYLPEGSTFIVEKAIPEKIKIKDFFTSICQMFNLWVDVHPTKSKTLIIEPREAYLGTEVVNIENKLANDRELKTFPMAKLDASDYLFTYKSDRDELNQRYEGQYSQIYGQRRIVNDNDFVNSFKKTEVIFSPTVLSAPPGDDKVISSIIGLDNTNQRKPIDHNIRILFYGGLKNCSNIWGMNAGVGGNNILTQFSLSVYPYAGHFDDPYTVTEDINFGLVQEVYYDSQTATPITVNNNNLYNKYYYKMLAEYTDKDSKLVTGYFNMSPSDFKNWTFDKLYFFENSYFRLQKVYNYNPTNADLTKCDFLYLVNAPDFTPEDLGLDGDNPIIDGPPFGTLDTNETKPVSGGKSQFYGDGNNTTGKSVTVNGKYNEVAPDSFYIDINGDGNKIESNVKNVLITGDDNVITSGFENITLINTNGVTVTESNVTYINGEKVESVTDHHNAFNTIKENESKIIKEFKQMAVVSQLKIETGAYLVIEPNAQLIVI